MSELETNREDLKKIPVTPYIKETHYGTYFVTEHWESKSTTLIGEQVCDSCQKNPPDSQFTLGDYSEAFPRKFFCSKECVISYLTDKKV